jgi:hypothetical protein
LTYLWKKKFFINNVNLDSEWKSPDKKFAVRPVINGKETSTIGYYKLEHDDADLKYKEKAIKEIEKVFTCYSLLNVKSVNIGYFIKDDLLNRDELEKKGLTIPPFEIGPMRFSIKPSFVSSNFDSAYNLYHKIISDKNANALETCIRWFKKGLSEELSYDKFLALWISFNAFYNMYWTSKKTSKNGKEAPKITFLAKNLFDENSSKNVITSKRCSDCVHYLISNFQGRYYSSTRRTDWIKKLSICLSKGQYHKALEKLLLSIYSIRGTLFHGEKGFSKQEEIVIIQANFPLVEIIRKCIELYFR